MTTKKALETELKYLKKDLEYLKKTFTNDSYINTLTRKIILNLFKAEQSPMRYDKYKPICLNCQQYLIIGKNIHRGYHICVCRSCRLDFMQIINQKQYKQYKEKENKNTGYV